MTGSNGLPKSNGSSLRSGINSPAWPWRSPALSVTGSNGLPKLKSGVSRLRSDDSGWSRSKNLPAPAAKPAPPARAAPPIAPPPWIKSPALSLIPSRGLLTSKLGMRLDDLSLSPSRGFERSISGALISGRRISPGKSSILSLERSNIPVPSAAAAAPPAIAAPPASPILSDWVLTGSTTPLKLIFGVLRLGRSIVGGIGKPDRSPDLRSPDLKSLEGR